MTPTLVVAGIGNPYRSDDGVGPAVAAAVAARAADAVDLGPVTEPLDLLTRWDGARLAVVVDAVSSGRPPGAILEVELGGDGPHDQPGGGTSTHGIGLVGALRLARLTGSPPDRVVLVAIEGESFSPGLGLTPAVAGAVPTAVERVLALLAGARGR